MMLRCKIMASIRKYRLFWGLFVSKCPQWGLGRVEMTPERSVPALWPSRDAVNGFLRGEGQGTPERLLKGC